MMVVSWPLPWLAVEVNMDAALPACGQGQQAVVTGVYRLRSNNSVCARVGLSRQAVRLWFKDSTKDGLLPLVVRDTALFHQNTRTETRASGNL